MDDATGFAVNHRYSKQGSLQIFWTSSTSVIRLQLRSRLSNEYKRENPFREATLFCDKSILTMLPIFSCQLSQMEKLFIARLRARRSWRQDISHKSLSRFEVRLSCCNLGTNLIAQSIFFILLLPKLITESFFQV